MDPEKKMEIGGAYLFRKPTLILTISDEVMS